MIAQEAGRGPLWWKNPPTQCPSPLHHGKCEPRPPRRFPGGMAEYCRKYSMAYFPEPHELVRTGPFLQ